jgi:2-desacetyl-2-hydroxyethyl bacteriochlorophyllide A dehydrogenase
MNCMSALVYEGPRTMTMRKVEMPRPAEGEVLVQVLYSGICGSELSGFLGQSSIRSAPLIFGHEIVGRVSDYGPGVDAEIGGGVGSAVVLNPLFSCRTCSYCLSGRQQLCPKRKLLGASMPGGNAEFVVVPSEGLHALPEDSDLAIAALGEPSAYAIHAVRASRAGAGDNALIVGAGPIGLFIAKVLVQYGVQPIWVAERNESRRAAAAAAGAVIIESDEHVAQAVREATGGSGVHIAFDAVGSPSTRLACVESVTPGGTVILSGLHTDQTSLPMNAIVRSEICLAGAFAYTPEDFNMALDWLQAGRLAIDFDIVKAPLSEGQLWYERLVDGDPTVKVMLEP